MWIPALAQAMEKIRANMIVFAYRVLYAGRFAQLARIEKERENLQKAEKAEARYSVDLDDAAEELHDLEIRAAGLDPDELMEARLALVEQWIFLDLMWSN